MINYKSCEPRKTCKSKSSCEPRDVCDSFCACEPPNCCDSFNGCEPKRFCESFSACEPKDTCDSKLLCEPKILPSSITIEQLVHLRSLVRKFEIMQKARISFENKIQAVMDNRTPAGRLGILYEKTVLDGVTTTNPLNNKQKRILSLKSYEYEIEKEIEKIVVGHRLWTEWLQYVDGIGILTAARIIAFFEPYWAGLEVVVRKKRNGETLTKKLFPPKSRSSFTILCGFGMDDAPVGQARAYMCRRELKNKRNSRFKPFFFNISECAIKKTGSKLNLLWKKYHEETKQNYSNYLKRWYNAETREQAKKLHPHKFIPSALDLSRRRFIKTFISIIWEQFQILYKLPVTPPQHSRGVPLTDDEWIHPCDLIKEGILNK